VVAVIGQRVAADLRPGIAHRAEDDRARRARLLARGLETRGGPVGFHDRRVDVGPANALYAERALLHHAPRAHGDVRIHRHLLGLRHLLGVIQEIEAANFVGTVVGAEPGADAAVVDHFVQSVRAVNGRVDRADVLTGRILAVLTEHRLDADARLRS